MVEKWYSRPAARTSSVTRSSSLAHPEARRSLTDDGQRGRRRRAGRPGGRPDRPQALVGCPRPYPVEMGPPIRRIRRLAIPVASVGAVAQLGERLNRTQEADGSIPFSSTTLLRIFRCKASAKRLKSKRLAFRRRVSRRSAPRARAAGVPQTRPPPSRSSGASSSVTRVPGRCGSRRRRTALRGRNGASPSWRMIRATRLRLVVSPSATRAR